MAAPGRAQCQPWCSPSKHLLCGSPQCCPHLHTKRATAKTAKPKRRRIW